MAAEDQQGGWWGKTLVDLVVSRTYATHMLPLYTAHAPYTRWQHARAATYPQGIKSV